MDDLHRLDATALAARIADGALDPRDLLAALVARAEALDPALNALVARFPDATGAAAQAAEEAAAGTLRGPLHGVPFTIKDSLDTAGVRTSRGSLLFREHVPAADAEAVVRLRAAGAIPLAKTNVPEFVLWWETGNRLDGQTCNPWDAARTSGGSSGGEAAAIAAGLSPLGIGSDLGGSIRLPASWCGVVGLKPTHGRVPTTGHWPATLDRFMHVGFLARSVRDVALALACASGADGRDPYALAVPPPQPLDALPEGLEVGVLIDAFGPVDPEVREAVLDAARALERQGCRVREAEAPPALADNDWNLLTLVLYGAGGGPYLARAIGDRVDELSPPLARRLGATPPSLADYVAAEEQVEALRRDVARLLARHDLLLCPTTPTTAPLHAQDHVVIDGARHHPRTSMRATLPFDITGSPAVAVPFGLSAAGLPLSVQVVGGLLDDARVLACAMALEQARGPLPVPPDAASAASPTSPR